MDKRELELNAKLREILGSNNVYFQPPKDLDMKYPAIRYENNIHDIDNADNMSYRLKRGYTVTHMSKIHDTAFIEAMLYSFKYIRFDREYTADNLYHNVFILYY